MSAALIDLCDVSKDYDSPAGLFTAIAHVTLQFGRGEHVAIVGRSGSGKSTLLNMLTGIDHPTRGKVIIDGVDVHKLRENALARWRGRSIGIVFQFFQLIPTLTILQNLLLAMEFVGVIPRAERVARAQALLAQVGIAAHSDKLPNALSGGEQQRAAIARALANDPPIIVADEPTGNLDSQTAEAIQSLLRQLSETGKTVVVVTHDAQASGRFARVITLLDGRVQNDSGARRVAAALRSNA